MITNKLYRMLKAGVISFLFPLSSFLFISCSDEPDSSNFYTFKGQMMS